MTTSSVSPTNDEALLDGISRGDEACLEALVRLWTPRLFSFCRAFLRDTQQTEEVVQDVFLKIWQKAELYDSSKGRASSWIFALAHRSSIDRLRKNRVKGAHLASPSDQIPALAKAPQAGADPHESLILKGALAHLSPAQAEVLRLAYFEGLTRSEIAEKLGEPIGTIKTRLRDALIRMRKVLAPGQSDHENEPLSCKKGESA